MSEKLRLEFNQWALDGRGAELEQPYLAFVEDTIGEMKIRSHERVLEVGCGEGWAARLLARLLPEGMVVGLDVSDEMIHNARTKSAHCENLMFVRGEAEDVPWQSEFFSKVLCVESFYYFEDPVKALHEIYRVMAPGAAVWILNHLSRENELSLRWLSELKVPVQLLGAGKYESLFHRCGFRHFSYRMIPDRTQHCGFFRERWFPDAAELRRFCELGALLMTATKPIAAD